MIVLKNYFKNMKFLVILLVVVYWIYYQYSHAIISIIHKSIPTNNQNISNTPIIENKLLENKKYNENSQKSQEILENYFKNSQENLVENNEISYKKIQQNTPETHMVLSNYLDSVSPVKEYQTSSYFWPRLQASKDYSYDFHRWVDYHNAENVDIFAIADGEIYKTYLESDPDNPYKNSWTTVIIKHILDKPYEFHGKKREIIYSYYTHLSEINKDFFEKYRKKIKKWEKIGKMWSSGTTNYHHLHFEIRVATICSREYQLKKPDSNCSKILPNNADPHINPFVFLPQEIQNNTYTISKKQNENSLSLTISTQRNFYGINTIIIQENGKEKIVDFNLRKSIDDINRDNNYFQWVKILPAQFSTRSNQYEISFEFENFTSQANIYVFDTLWKNINY